jgi:transglutaminase-like putative cysteine protease
VNAASFPTRRWLSVSHETRYRYTTPVESALHAACLTPRDTPWQRVREWQLELDPLPSGWAHSSEAAGRLRRDVWGNAHLVFGHARVHERLLVASRFEVGLLERAAPNPHRGPAWEAVATRLRAALALNEADEFVLASPFALADAAIEAFARRAFSPGRVLADAGLALMRQIHTEFRYLPASTSVSTRPAEALALRSGVCQDFAQVFIAGCRALGLAARYVSGYLLTHPAPGQARLVGADATHAWVELWCPEQGWLGLDPTNAVSVNQDHVTLAWGRDYADVAPLRGVLTGGGAAAPSVSVTVTPLPPRDEGARGADQ